MAKSFLKRSRRRQPCVKLEQLELRVLLDASGLLGALTSLEIPEQNSEQVLLGDMNNDGDLDAVVLSNHGWSRVLVNDGHGNFQPATSTFGSERPRDSVLADFDGDGDLDVAIGDGLIGTEIWWNLGNYEFARSGTVLTAGIATNSVAISDLNDDSSIDLVIGAGRGELFVFLNDGYGNFAQANGRQSSGATILGDFNRDNFIDLIVSGSTGLGGQLLVNDGTGHLSRQGRSLLTAPRTDPYVRNYRIRLLPWIMTTKTAP